MCSQYRLHHNLRLCHLEVAVIKMMIWMVTEWHSWKSRAKTNYMAQSPSLIANTSSGSPEISCILRNLKACYRVHGKPPLVLIPSQMNPVYNIPAHFFNLLKPTGHVMHRQFNIQQLYALPTLYLCVLHLSENKTATCATYSINWLVFITEI